MLYVFCLSPIFLSLSLPLPPLSLSLSFSSSLSLSHTHSLCTWPAISDINIALELSPSYTAVFPGSNFSRSQHTSLSNEPARIGGPVRLRNEPVWVVKNLFNKYCSFVLFYPDRRSSLFLSADVFVCEWIFNPLLKLCRCRCRSRLKIFATDWIFVSDE